jgi:hypothetical protein
MGGYTDFIKSGATYSRVLVSWIAKTTLGKLIWDIFIKVQIDSVVVMVTRTPESGISYSFQKMIIHKLYRYYYWICGLCQSSGIHKRTSISETGFVSILS